MVVLWHFGFFLLLLGFFSFWVYDVSEIRPHFRSDAPSKTRARSAVLKTLIGPVILRLNSCFDDFSLTFDSRHRAIAQRFEASAATGHACWYA